MLRREQLVSIVSLVFILSSQSMATERDSGSSNNLLIKVPINDKWFVISRSNLAYRNDFDDLFLGFTGGGLGYQLTEEWSLRAGYRHVWFKPQNDWLEEDRLYIETFFANRFERFRLTNRTRFEFRFFDYRENDVRIRNELVIESSKSIPGTVLRPYLEEEFFYSTNADLFEANWLGGGVAWRPIDGLKLKLGYRWNRFRVGDEWRDRDTLVAGINVFF